MARDFQIPGSVMVYVQGGAHISGSISTRSELGLSNTQIRVAPKWNHGPIMADDFRGDVPPELQYRLLEARVRMSLVDIDYEVLQACVVEANVGGQVLGARANPVAPAGAVGRPGGTLGRGKPVLASGNHFIEMILFPVTDPLAVPTPAWRFKAATLTSNPYDENLGVETNIIDLEWRAIPYIVPTPYLQTVSGRIPIVSGATSLSGYVSVVDGGFIHNIALRPGKNWVMYDYSASGSVVWDRAFFNLNP